MSETLTQVCDSLPPAAHLTPNSGSSQINFSRDPHPRNTNPTFRHVEERGLIKTRFPSALLSQALLISILSKARSRGTVSDWLSLRWILDKLPKGPRPRFHVGAIPRERLKHLINARFIALHILLQDRNSEFLHPFSLSTGPLNDTQWLPNKHLLLRIRDKVDHKGESNDES
jgi:hypothetical protein